MKLGFINRIGRNLSFIFKYDLDNCFKNHNEEIERLIDWNISSDYDAEQMRQGAREMFSMQEDAIKGLSERENKLIDDILYLKKQLSTQKARITRQTNEQNKEYDFYIEQLRNINKDLNELKLLMFKIKSNLEGKTKSK